MSIRELDRDDELRNHNNDTPLLAHDYANTDTKELNHPFLPCNCLDLFLSLLSLLYRLSQQAASIRLWKQVSSFEYLYQLLQQLVDATKTKHTNY